MLSLRQNLSVTQCRNNFVVFYLLTSISCVIRVPWRLVDHAHCDWLQPRETSQKNEHVYFWSQSHHSRNCERHFNDWRYDVRRRSILDRVSAGLDAVKNRGTEMNQSQQLHAACEQDVSYMRQCFTLAACLAISCRNNNARLITISADLLLHTSSLYRYSLWDATSCQKTPDTLSQHR